jgi:hypothetical protein
MFSTINFTHAESAKLSKNIIPLKIQSLESTLRNSTQLALENINVFDNFATSTSVKMNVNKFFKKYKLDGQFKKLFVSVLWQFYKPSKT